MEQPLQQINVSYHAAQDRMLLKAGLSQAQEVQLWITYRIARQLFAVLNQDANIPVFDAASIMTSPSEALAQFVKEASAVETLKSMDCNADYEHNRTPLVESGELLITDFATEQHDPNTTEANRLKSIKFLCANGMTVDIKLSRQLILAIANSLLVLSKEALWSLTSMYPAEGNDLAVKTTPSHKQGLH